MQLKNTSDLRSILAEQIDKLRANETTPSYVNAISTATGRWLESIRLEIEASKLTGKQPNLALLRAANSIAE